MTPCRGTASLQREVDLILHTPHNATYDAGQALSAYGSGETLTVRSRPLANCSWSTHTPEAHSTTHLKAGGAKFVEVGWVEDADGHFSWFGEANDGTCAVACWGGFDNGGTLPDPGSTPYDARFWLGNISGTQEWHLFVDWTGDGQADASIQTPDLNFNHGIPKGETGRRPTGPGTSALDHHDAMQFQNGNGNWVAWKGNKVASDDMCNFDWSYVHDDEYRVQPSGSC